MVATKLSVVVGKGWEWYSGAPPPSAEGGSAPPIPPPASAPAPSPSSYWNTAQDSLQQSAEQTYSTVTGYVSSIYTMTTSDDDVATSFEADHVMENLPVTPKRSNTTSILTSPALLNLFHNPYISVRGGGRHQAQTPSSSMEAVRSLLSVVPATTPGMASDHVSEASNTDSSLVEEKWLPSLPERSSQTPPTSSSSSSSTSLLHSSPSETASQLAEGTLRACRDIALDEAVELHAALRYWSYRWERPLLSWLEAGPTVWFTDRGYRHQEIGQKVSRIQAVLARRCATIGDLQQHLLRAGWQRGVAQWGVLGDGGEWAAVAGFDGGMHDSSTRSTSNTANTTNTTSLRSQSQLRRVSSELIDHSNIPPPTTRQDYLPRQAPISNVSNLPQRSRHNQLYYANLFVKNNHGGQIFIDNPALAEWSVDAMSLVRRQMYRAANGMVVLPYAENWAEGDDQSRHSLGGMSDHDTAATDEMVPSLNLPLWASLQMAPVHEEEERMEGDDYDDDNEPQTVTRVTISDLPLMVSEVSDLLDVMESVMDIQRGRRLEKLKPPFWLRQNWYIGAIVFPPLSYFCYKTAVKGYGLTFLNYTAQKLVEFFREHVVDPFFAL